MMFHLCNVVLLLLDCFYFYFVARKMERYLSNVPWLKMNCGRDLNSQLLLFFLFQ